MYDLLWKGYKIIVDITFLLILGRTNYFQQIKENKLYLYQNYKVIIYFHALHGFEISNLQSTSLLAETLLDPPHLFNLDEEQKA